MEDNKSAINVTIQDTKYRQEGKTIYCDMVIKVNLNNFEQQYHQFTTPFVKKVLGEHLPIIKTILNPSYSDFEPVVAKYYIIPGGGARVLAFNKKYYKRHRGFDDSQMHEVGDVIPMKQVLKACGECDHYDYCQTFTVTGKAVCLPEDEFNEEKGKTIASAKATQKAAKRISRLFSAIYLKTNGMMTAIANDYEKSLNWLDSANKIVDSNEKNA